VPSLNGPDLLEAFGVAWSAGQSLSLEEAVGFALDEA
jgi:hypothetical protein